MTDPAAPSLYDSFGLYGSGVTLVTTQDPATGRDDFFIAASVLTSSVNPFTIAVSVGQDRDALPPITGGAPWALAVLTTEHLPLVRQLTAPTTRDERLHALTAAGAEPSPEGPLWLPDALVTLWCITRSTTPVNDQVLLIGEVLHGSRHHDALPLLRWNRGFRTVADLPSQAASA